MTNPTVSLASLKFKGDALEFQGSADLGGDTGATLNFFLDPQPSGTSLGPFPLTPLGVAYAQANTPLGHGKWKVRVIATPSGGGTPVQVQSPELSVNNIQCRLVLPGVGGTIVPSAPNTGLVFTNPVTHLQYNTAITAAPLGQKRVAAANVVIQALGSNSRLRIFQNGVIVIQVEYKTSFTLDAAGTDVMIRPGLQKIASVLSTADLSIGKWEFELQGGPLYSVGLHGSVGAVGSGKDILIASNPTAGMGFASDYTLLMPRAMDGVS